jgi:predicted XRE-type DNA-binding protein
MAYRWVWRLVHGEDIPVGKMILHSCDRGGYPIGCCNPAHLSLGDHQGNMDDMKRRERHGLPATAVTAIRRLLDRGETQQEIADKFGVSRETISAIATGRVYKDGAARRAANISLPDAETQGVGNNDSPTE